MSALANRDFIKMNGLGNEIVIVDLRQAPSLVAQSPIAAAEALAAARLEPYDQLMALYPGRGGNDASIRIYNNDGSEAGACGNGMRCVASLISAETGKATLNFETSAGIVSCWPQGTERSPSTWERRVFAGTRFRWRGRWPIRARSSCNSDRRMLPFCARRPS